MTYLAAWWQKFSGMSRKLFNSHVVQKAVQEAMALSNMRSSYIEQATTFEAFATKWLQILSEPSSGSSFRDLQAAFMQFDDFESSDFLSYDALLMQVGLYIYSV
jgi:archaellin